MLEGTRFRYRLSKDKEGVYNRFTKPVFYAVYLLRLGQVEPSLFVNESSVQSRDHYEGNIFHENCLTFEVLLS